MRNRLRAFPLTFGLLLSLSVPSAAAPPPVPAPSPDPSRLLSILEGELNRNFKILREKADPPPYFISYQVTEEHGGTITGKRGGLSEPGISRRRVLDCSVRVGSPELDNYHLMDGNRPRVTASSILPVEDRPEPIQVLVWRETDRAWRAAADRLIRVKTSTRNPSAGEQSKDFSAEKPATAMQPVTPLKFNREEWAGRIRRLSLELSNAPGILDSSVILGWRTETKTLVSSEGARLHHGRTFARVSVIARAKAADGEDLMALENFEAVDFAGLPPEAVLMKSVRDIQASLRQLLKAQPADPYAGPAILSGRASAVFFHEIFGHRIEGHRQADQTEGQTWSKSVNTKVLPDFLSVIFDPTQRQYEKTDLNGWYQFDDEGVAAQRVTVVDKGTLKTFLLSRSPIPGFPSSNGHGRRQPGLEPVARQSNLLVESAKRVDEKDLRKMLVEEAARQGKPYGLYFDMVTGGFTTTRRNETQAFTVMPLVVYKVFADGRPDELVRGVDIIGTPLASFSKILATSNRAEIFNGYCGAESGNVPVSAVSPAILVSEIEIQRKSNRGDRPPLLPPPDSGGGL